MTLEILGDDLIAFAQAGEYVLNVTRGSDIYDVHAAQMVSGCALHNSLSLSMDYANEHLWVQCT